MDVQMPTISVFWHFRETFFCHIAFAFHKALFLPTNKNCRVGKRKWQGEPVWLHQLKTSESLLTWNCLLLSNVIGIVFWMDFLRVIRQSEIKYFSKSSAHQEEKILGIPFSGLWLCLFLLVQNQNTINLGSRRAVCIGFHIQRTVVHELLACGHRICSFSFQYDTLILVTSGKILFPFCTYVFLCKP